MQSRRINIIEAVNSDPMLSDFKHHFILRKIRVPRELSFNDFADELYRVFGKDFALENTIYIVQIVKSHEHHCYDIAVGLRRDADAVKIARDLGQFRLEGYSMEIELAPAFSCFYDQLNRISEKEREEELCKQNHEPRSPALHLSNNRSNSSSSSSSSSSSASSSSASRSRSRSREGSSSGSASGSTPKSIKRLKHNIEGN